MQKLELRQRESRQLNAEYLYRWLLGDNESGDIQAIRSTNPQTHRARLRAPFLESVKSSKEQLNDPDHTIHPLALLINDSGTETDCATPWANRVKYSDLTRTMCRSRI